jgi:hypothetical protein
MSEGPIQFTIPGDYYRLAMIIGRKVECRCGFGIHDRTIYATSEKEHRIYIHYYCDDCLPEGLR